MHNLRIVSLLSEQDKLVTGPRFGLRTPTTFRSLARWWHGEGRETDLQHLRALFSAAICVARLARVEEAAGRVLGASVASERILDAVMGALDGLRVLMRTYHDDQETCAKLDILVQEAEDLMRPLSHRRLVTTARSSPPRMEESGTRDGASPAGRGSARRTLSTRTAPSVSPPE